MDDREMIDIEEHLQRSIGSEEVGMPTKKWVAVLEEMRQLRKENKALRERLAQPVHASDISQEPVDETAKDRHISYVCPNCHWSLDKQVRIHTPEDVKKIESKWVGLTDGEKEQLVEKFYGTDIQRLEAIEAKLKEKNQ